jgi:MYXO-CTERM domain-containing protein
VAGNTGSGGPFCISWSDRAFVYHADLAGSLRTPGTTEFEAIDRAFATWQAIADGCSDLHFEAGVRLVAPRVGLGTEAAHVLTFREVDCAAVVDPTDPCLADDACGNAHACWGHSRTAIALTTLTFLRHTGVALDADVEFNAAGFLFTTVDGPPCPASRPGVGCVATDLQETLTHELGHVVGLDHIDGSGSTMAPTAPPGETSKRRIDPGTAAGFCQIYPRGQPSPSCDPAAGPPGAPGCGCQGASSGPALLGLAVAALAWRRRVTRW